MLCLSCGNEMDEGQKKCLVCKAKASLRRRASDMVTHLCHGCGNEVLASEECPVCAAGVAQSTTRRTSLCPGCGNDVDAGEACPVCAAGRAASRKRRHDGPECPQCRQVLEPQDWDGVPVLMCAECNGCFFEPDGLERMLDKLRQASEQPDLVTALAEFRDRHRSGSMPDAVRYQPCPQCEASMTRRNYAGVSGIIIDVCGPHGTWVTQHAIGALSDFISRGGDLLTKR